MREQGSVHYVRKSDELILFIEGEVTAHLAQSMYAHLAEDLDPPSFSRIYAELSEASYVDSTTIGTFIKLKKILERHEGVLILCNPSEKDKRILSDMHLLTYFTVTDSSALQALRRDVLTRISPDHKDLLSADYLLDAHRAIVQEAPHLQQEFDALIKALEAQTLAQSSSGESDRNH